MMDLNSNNDVSMTEFFVGLKEVNFDPEDFRIGTPRTCFRILTRGTMVLTKEMFVGRPTTPTPETKSATASASMGMADLTAKADKDMDVDNAHADNGEKSRGKTIKQATQVATVISSLGNLVEEHNAELSSEASGEDDLGGISDEDFMERIETSLRAAGGKISR